MSNTFNNNDFDRNKTTMIHLKLFYAGTTHGMWCNTREEAETAIETLKEVYGKVIELESK